MHVLVNINKATSGYRGGQSWGFNYILIILYII